MNRRIIMEAWQPRKVVLSDKEIQQIIGDDLYPAQFHYRIQRSIDNIVICIRHAQTYTRFNEKRNKQ